MEQCQTRTYTPSQYLSTQHIKFLCAIAREYEFICPALPVYYDPVTYQPTFLIDRLHQEYRADFLIRHRDSGEAFLVDVVPLSFWDDQRLSLNRQIAQNYIQWKGYDWKYKCVFEEEVSLNVKESSQFNSYEQLKNDNDREEWLRNFLSLVQKPEPFNGHRFSVLDFLIHGIGPKTN